MKFYIKAIISIFIFILCIFTGRIYYKNNENMKISHGFIDDVYEKIAIFDLKDIHYESINTDAYIFHSHREVVFEKPIEVNNMELNSKYFFRLYLHLHNIFQINHNKLRAHTNISLYDYTNLQFIIEWSYNLMDKFLRIKFTEIEEILSNSDKKDNSLFLLSYYRQNFCNLNQNMKILDLFLPQAVDYLKKIPVKSEYIKLIDTIIKNLLIYQKKCGELLKFLQDNNKHSIYSGYVYIKRDFTNVANESFSSNKCSKDNKFHGCNIYFQNSFITYIVNIETPINHEKNQALYYDNMLINYITPMIEMLKMDFAKDEDYKIPNKNRMGSLKVIIKKYLSILLEYNKFTELELDNIVSYVVTSLAKQNGMNVIVTNNYDIVKNISLNEVKILYLTGSSLQASKKKSKLSWL